METEVYALTKGRGYRPFEGLVGIDLVWLSPAPRALDNPDLDNVLKPFIDALCERVIGDDRQVDRIVAERYDVNLPPDRVATMMHDFFSAPAFDGEVTIVFLEALS